MAVRGVAVGRHCALQSDKSRVRLLIWPLCFFIDFIFLATIWPRCFFGPLTEMSTGDFSLAAKAAGAYG